MVPLSAWAWLRPANATIKAARALRKRAGLRMVFGLLQFCVGGNAGRPRRPKRIEGGTVPRYRVRLQPDRRAMRHDAVRACAAAFRGFPIEDRLPHRREVPSMPDYLEYEP